MGDDLDPARGILLAALVSILFWVVVGIILWRVVF